MDTESYQSSGNSYRDSSPETPAAEGESWPGAAPPAGGESWPGAAPPAGGESWPGAAAAAEGESWPGVSRPAEWFLHPSARQRGTGARPGPGAVRTSEPGPSPHREPDGSWSSPPRPEPRSAWQRSQRHWDDAGIQWQQPQGRRDGPTRYPLGAPAFSAPSADEDHSYSREDRRDGTREGRRAGTREISGADQRDDAWLTSGEDRWGDDRLPIRARPAGLSRRRSATVALPVVVLLAVAVLALALLTGHGPESGPLAANPGRNAGPAAPRLPLSLVTFGTYPGREQRGVFQIINRVVASGNTIVAIGSHTSDGVVRQQFFVSANAGASWRLAALKGQPPLGHQAALLAGGQGGWVAVGPQAIWTSPDGLTWTLAAAHGISPRLPGDSVWVITKTANGFVAAGAGAGTHTASQAVIWTSRDGLNWRRMTAAQLGLAGPGETVLNISHATWHGNDTVIAGTVTRDGTSYDAAWLSTDNGTTWTRVTIPADHGAGTTITGLGFDSSGLIAVRPGRSASGVPDGVSYFSPDGQGWQYSGTIDPGPEAGGWTPGVVKGGDDGFVVTGASGSGQLVAYTSAGTGTTWLPTGPLGDAAAESVVGAAVAPGGTVVAVGYTAAGRAGQQPVFLEASTGGTVRQVPVAGIAGATVPELAVNSTAIAGGQQVAVGSADGYPAVWQRKLPGGPWALVSSLALVQPLAGGASGLRTLTSVTHGPAGWLAVGAPGPVILTSSDGTSWEQAGGNITQDLAGVAAVAAAAGPAGYVIVGKLVAPGGDCVADVWWSPNLTSWTRAQDLNDAAGSSQVLAVAASAHGFVSAGSHDGKPAVWTTANGRSWETIVLPAPGGAATAVLQQIAVSGNRVVALGQASTGTGPAGPPAAFAELSADGGATWRQVPFSSPGPDTTFTALTADGAGFAAAGLSGQAGPQQVTVWTSGAGADWKQSQASALAGSEFWKITALAPAGGQVTGIGSILTQQGQPSVTFILPAR